MIYRYVGPRDKAALGITGSSRNWSSVLGFCVIRSRSSDGFEPIEANDILMLFNRPIIKFFGVHVRRYDVRFVLF